MTLSIDLQLIFFYNLGKTRLGAHGAHEIMVHPWFNSIDWDNIDYIPPPMVPSKDINMATQSEIGTFADEKAFKKVELTEDDHKIYNDWEFISAKQFQEEVVEFLIYEDILVSTDFLSLLSMIFVACF